MLHKSKNLFDKLFRDAKGHIVIAQFPNGAIIGWAICVVLDMLIGTGVLHFILHFSAQVFLLVWAFEEIQTGASLFRRILGGVVLIVLVLSFFK